MSEMPDLTEAQVEGFLRVTMRTADLPVKTQFDLLCHAVLVAANIALTSILKELRSKKS